jgi:2-succinyl-5-enolpyruvyl-6-hydroxy-3-cyclohexene-1-carboxylate synthase
MFGFEYSTAHNLKTLQQKVVNFYDTSDKPKILEIFTPSDQNDLVLKAYINNLK